MYCVHCGKKIEQESKFCPYCGKQTTETTQSNMGKGKTKPKAKLIAVCLVAVCVIVTVIILIVQENSSPYEMVNSGWNAEEGRYYTIEEMFEKKK